LFFRISPSSFEARALALAPQGDGERQEAALSSSTQDIEEGVTFTPKFDANGLVSAVVTDVRTGDVLIQPIA
jgi:hypothetical protein